MQGKQKWWALLSLNISAITGSLLEEDVEGKKGLLQVVHMYLEYMWGIEVGSYTTLCQKQDCNSFPEGGI